MFKWVGLRLIQIRWVMDEFINMDKNCHPYCWPWPKALPNKLLIMFCANDKLSIDLKT